MDHMSENETEVLECPDCGERLYAWMAPVACGDCDELGAHLAAVDPSYEGWGQVGWHCSNCGWEELTAAQVVIND